MIQGWTYLLSSGPWLARCTTLPPSLMAVQQRGACYTFASHCRPQCSNIALQHCNFHVWLSCCQDMYARVPLLLTPSTSASLPDGLQISIVPETINGRDNVTDGQARHFFSAFNEAIRKSFALWPSLAPFWLTWKKILLRGQTSELRSEKSCNRPGMLQEVSADLGMLDDAIQACGRFDHLVLPSLAILKTWQDDSGRIFYAAWQFRTVLPVGDESTL